MPIFQPLDWCPSALTSPAKTEMSGIPDEIRDIRYPFRLLRYWMIHQLLLAEAVRREGTPMRVCEIGVDNGQMLVFSQKALEAANQSTPWNEWHAVDCLPNHEQLQKAGYGQIFHINIEDSEQMAQLQRGHYDVVIVLHVLEHLHVPGRVLADIHNLLKPGGIILGGCPVTPEIARPFWQRKLRRNNRPFGHVSVVSGALLRRWAEYLGLQTELMTGAFFMRKKGFALENYVWWLRLNLAFGSLFPSWPGEIYWSWRKTTPPAAPLVESAAQRPLPDTSAS